MTINVILAALRDELAADGVPAPLSQSLTLAAVWADLARLAGEEPPAAVVALLGTPEGCVRTQTTAWRGRSASGTVAASAAA